ncbi:uncharacterized protein [Cebidichthys violaceus]|uniref:uncharacterized protein n=1 Tax=Cebidichthys violaceus TaxID=271503 RepID=UPI0035CB0F27
MPDLCAAVGCSVERNALTKQQGVTFHKFPKDTVKRQAWTVAMKKTDFEPSKRSVICSYHFKAEDYYRTGQMTRLKEGATPSLFDHHLSEITENSSVCGDHFTKDCYTKTIKGVRKRKRGTVSSLFVRSTTKSGRRKGIRSSHADDAPRGQDAPEQDVGSKSRIVEASLPYADHDYCQRPPSLEEQQLQEARKTIACQEEELLKLRKNRFFLERFQCDDRLIMFYTGFRDYITLMAVFMALQPTAESMLAWGQSLADQSLPLSDQFFLFLCHLRQGFLVQDLATRFNVSQATVSSICITWTNFLYYTLGSILVWPSREKVNELMPLSFKNTFPRTRVILDCTELQVKRAASKVLNSETYPHLKGSITLKSLVGISPYGELTFVSDLFKGSMSDKDITQSSGILSLLEEGDEVMADKDFFIGDVLSPINVGLVTPAFSKPNRKLTPEEKLQTQEIARLRIHVERAIRRIKEYHIFERTLPMTTLGSINQVWKVCALLTTFQGPVF